MPLYEFITPSDPITFRAPDNRIAFVCALILGNGKAFCEREDGESIDTCFALGRRGELDGAITVMLGTTLKEFTAAHSPAIADAFDSFSYGHFSDRQQYDDALAAITDPGELAEFKAKHDDRRRTSISQWVTGAWNYAGNFRAKAAEKTAATA